MNLGIIASSIQVSSASYLLDTYTGVGAAYSLRKISSTATNAIQIKRNSDNSTTNIGFVGNDLDTTAINTFCSGTTCTVQTWYDQGPHGYHLGAPATPWTIYSGSLVTLNSMPALENGNDNGMTVSVERSHLTGSSQMYYIGTLVPNSSGNLTSIGSDQVYGDESGFGYYDGTFSTVVGYVFDSIITYGAQTVLEVVYESSSNIDLYADGSALTLTIDGPGIYAPTGTTTLDVGVGTDKIQEVII